MAPTTSTPASSGSPSTPSHHSNGANGLAELNPADPLGAAAPAGSDGHPMAHVSPGNAIQLHQLITGCKVWVERPEPEEPRKAEILSIRATRQPRPPRNKDGTRPKVPDEHLKPATEYYVHYVEFNKRLDEWIPSTRLLLDRPVEWPVPKEAQAGHGAHGHAAPLKARPSKNADQGLRKTAIKQAASKAGARKSSNNKRDRKRQKLTPTPATSATPPPAQTEDEDSMIIDSPSTRSVSMNPDRESSVDGMTPKEGTPDEDADGEADAEGDIDDGNESTTAEAVISVELVDDNEEVDDEADPSEAAAPNSLQKHSTFSKEEEIESLRSHGSMTQSVHEVARVKNLDRIQMGAHEVEAWYFSPYPVEYAHIPILYICEFCLCFFGSPKMLQRHRTKCTLLHPPGNEIYRHEDISFYEIDGKKQKTWCRNLCLLSKCFLDHKTLYYDVDPFLFYVMTKRDEFGVHTIGYFSKEKESAENYNLACILTLPQHQRHGYGKLLIEFSYELSKKENRQGSPEKPLSDLGLLSYRAYWQEIIVDYILQAKASGRDEVSVDEIAQKTSLVHADIMHTVQTLQMLKFYKNQHVLCLSDALIEQHERIKKKKRRRIHPESLIWKPPVFTKDQLRFGW